MRKNAVRAVWLPAQPGIARVWSFAEVLFIRI